MLKLICANSEDDPNEHKNKWRFQLSLNFCNKNKLNKNNRSVESADRSEKILYSLKWK